MEPANYPTVHKVSDSPRVTSPLLIVPPQIGTENLDRQWFDKRLPLLQVEEAAAQSLGPAIAGISEKLGDITSSARIYP